MKKPTKQYTDDATKELLRRIDEKLDELSKWLKEQNTKYQYTIPDTIPEHDTYYICQVDNNHKSTISTTIKPKK